MRHSDALGRDADFGGAELPWCRSGFSMGRAGDGLSAETAPMKASRPLERALAQHEEAFVKRWLGRSLVKRMLWIQPADIKRRRRRGRW